MSINPQDQQPKRLSIEERLQQRVAPKTIEERLKAKVKTPLGLPGQFALGLAEAQTFGPELGFMATQYAQTPNQKMVQYRQVLADDVADMLLQKQTGVWSDEDEARLESLQNQLKNPLEAQKILDRVELPSVGVSSALQAMNYDTEPKNWLEFASRWSGFLKNPSKMMGTARNIYRAGLNPKMLTKAITPGMDEARALSAGYAMQLAHEDELGPIGSIALTLMGDFLPVVTGGTAKGAMAFLKNPSQAIAKGVNLLTGSNSQSAWIRELIKDSKELGVQLDAGTLTNSNLVRMLQAKAAQSSLTGEAMQEFRQNFSRQVLESYKKIAETIGNERFENKEQVADALKEHFKDISEMLNLPTAYEPIEFLNQIGTSVENDIAGGEALKKATNEIKEVVSGNFSNAWDAFDNSIADISFESKEMADFLREFIKENSQSLLRDKVSAEYKVVDAARKLYKSFVKETLFQEVERYDPKFAKALLSQIKKGLDYKTIGQSLNKTYAKQLKEIQSLTNMTLEDIVNNIKERGHEVRYTEHSAKTYLATKRSLQELADYQFGGSKFQGKFKKLASEIDTVLKENLPEAQRAEFETLNEQFKAYKDTFENPKVIELFNPSNRNYSELFNRATKDMDAMATLEDIMAYSNDYMHQGVLNQAKRRFTERMLRDGKLSETEIGNLQKILGSRYSVAIREAAEGLKSNKIKKVAIPSDASPISKARASLWNDLAGKSPEQIASMMKTPSGVKRMKTILERTPEGEQLWKEISRWKLEDMVMKDLWDSVKEQTKFGTFKNIGRTPEDKQILKTILGKDGLKKFEKLQKLTHKMNESASRFLNTSQSASTAIDAAIIYNLFSAIMTGNAWKVGSMLSKGVAMRKATGLLTNPVFLETLEKGLTPQSPDYKKLWEKLLPIIMEISVEAQA